MRAILDIGEHSVFAPALRSGGVVLDAGANKGRFGKEVSALFPVKVIYVEANPVLAGSLRQEGACIVECALGGAAGEAVFNIGHNSEASSLRQPAGNAAHLVIKEAVKVTVKPVATILHETGTTRLCCAKLDIEGGEIDVLRAVADKAAAISPQWTVEFHDDAEFGLCSRAEVDAALSAMCKAGFSLLVRNWPSRTNSLFVDRNSLGIGLLQWWIIKLRYQYIAWLWRKLRGL